MMNIDTAKSYATEQNLIAALTKLGLAERSPMIVRNREGRWTAIFSAQMGQFDGNITLAARHGFKTFA